MRGRPGSPCNSQLSGAIPVLLNRTSCLCGNSVFLVVHLLALRNRCTWECLFISCIEGTALKVCKRVKEQKEIKTVFVEIVGLDFKARISSGLRAEDVRSFFET